MFKLHTFVQGSEKNALKKFPQKGAYTRLFIDHVAETRKLFSERQLPSLTSKETQSYKYLPSNILILSEILFKICTEKKINSLKSYLNQRSNYTDPAAETTPNKPILTCYRKKRLKKKRSAQCFRIAAAGNFTCLYVL